MVKRKQDRAKAIIPSMEQKLVKNTTRKKVGDRDNDKSRI
tara:strand:+ start:1253 stop:1372 length:120 start_codon:yes stop_codon:yes gene_type:complete